MKCAEVDVGAWMDFAQDRPAWKSMIRNIEETAAIQKPHPTLLKRAIPRAEARERYS